MGVLLSVALFGSVARGDDDVLSDLDVLAIVENNTGKVEPSTVLAHLPPSLRSGDPTISWYGAERFRQMSAAGDLFAWHVFLDGRPLYDPSSLFAALGEPALYERAADDVDAFLEIATQLPAQLAGAAFNAVYEMGVLYVCLRNVAMSASWHLADRPDFTRLAPYRLAAQTLPLCVPEEEYRASMLCRMASQRGLGLPDEITADRVLRYHAAAFDWMVAVRALLDRR